MEKKPVTSRDLWSLRFVGDADLSSTGDRLVWVETWINARQNRYESAIYLATREENGDFGSPRKITYGTRSDGGNAIDGHPRISPDGTNLAFMSNRSGKNHIWVLNLRQGGEARQITFGDDSPSQMKWAPDSRCLAFVARPPKSGKRSNAEPSEGSSEGSNEADSPKEHIDTGKDVTVITRLRYKMNGVPGFLDQRPTHIYIVDIETNEVRQLTAGDFQDSSPTFSPDGAEVAFLSCREEDRDIAVRHLDLWTIPFEGGDAKKLTSGQGPVAEPCYSPDGKSIAFFGHTYGLETTRNMEVLLIGRDGGEIRNLWGDFDRSVGSGIGSDSFMDAGRSGPFWSHDCQTLYFIASSGGYSGIYKVQTDGVGGPGLIAGRVPGNILACPKYPPVIHSMAQVSTANGQAVFAFIGCSSVNPGDVYAVCMPDGLCGGAGPHADGECALQQVTAVNREFLDTLSISEPEAFTFASTDGLVLDGWSMKPRGFKKGEKYPAVVHVHGGPRAAYGEAFFLEFQLLASCGFGVFYCNPRGSSCYGKAFADGVIGDWGGMDFQDIMALREHAGKVSWVDDARVGITGGSYGGYMTNWAVGQTNRFRAAVSCRSISNMYTKYGVSDIGWFGNKAGFAGRDLWDSEDFIMERSPIRYAPKVETPILLIQSEQDYRCPMEQAEQYYVALKRLGKTVEFVRFAGENHELSRSGKPWNRVERLQHIARWFQEHLN